MTLYLIVSKRKPGRRYDVQGRREQARRNRAIIVEVARRTFLKRGYAATTITAIAKEAGVSVETIYKAFGGKPGLVRAIYQRGLEGRGDKPAPERSDAMSASETDPRAIVRRWGAFTSEVSPLVSPILLLVRAAAATDRKLAAILREADDERLKRMRHNARRLADRGFLANGVTVESAAEIMWAYTAPELYELFVIRRGWTPERFGAHVAIAMTAALLPQV